MYRRILKGANIWFLTVFISLTPFLSQAKDLGKEDMILHAARSKKHSETSKQTRNLKGEVIEAFEKYTIDLHDNVLLTDYGMLSDSGALFILDISRIGVILSPTDGIAAAEFLGLLVLFTTAEQNYLSAVNNSCTPPIQTNEARSELLATADLLAEFLINHNTSAKRTEDEKIRTLFFSYAQAFISMINNAAAFCFFPPSPIDVAASNDAYETARILAHQIAIEIAKTFSSLEKANQ